MSVSKLGDEVCAPWGLPDAELSPLRGSFSIVWVCGETLWLLPGQETASAQERGTVYFCWLFGHRMILWCFPHPEYLRQLSSSFILEDRTSTYNRPVITSFLVDFCLHLRFRLICVFPLLHTWAVQHFGKPRRGPCCYWRLTGSVPEGQIP